MKLRTLGFFLRQVAVSLRRNGWVR
ncbi:cell division protein FtsX, partial [Calderihabitans maritimus]